MKSRKWLNYINGKWCDSNEQIEVFNPANNELVGCIAKASINDAEQALIAAKNSFKSGVLTTIRPVKRSQIMRNIATEIRRKADEGAEILMLENGKKKADTKDEFDEAAAYFEYYAGLADKIDGTQIPLGESYIDFTSYEPYGVSVQIVPWNFPVGIAARSLAPALACGNSVVVKSPELTPLALVILFEAIAEAGLPDGVANLLCGTGSEVGAYLTASELTNQIVFTGSVRTGQTIMMAAAENVIPTTMELGGKSAAIAFADTDIATLVDNVKVGIFFNSGQVCSAMSRLLVEKSIYQEVLKRLKEMAEALTIGSGAENNDITPLLTAEQRDGVDAFCRNAKQAGAKLLTGGNKVECDGGHYFQPTIFYDVEPNSDIAQQEVFGPVLCVMSFTSEAAAVELANATRFGLVSGVFTNDISRALRVSKVLDSGQVFVNEWFAGGIETPFGGNKLSGFGREKGQAAIYSYLRLKNTAIRLS